MKVELEATKRIIEERAAGYYPELKGAAVELRQLPFRESSTHPIYLFELRNPGAVCRTLRIVVKFAPVYPENNENKTEYDNMSRLHSGGGSSDPELGCIRPLDFISETDAVVSEFVDAERFSPWFMKACCVGASPTTRRQLRERVRQAGCWLAMMHARTANDTIRLGDSTFAETNARLTKSILDSGVLQRELSDVSAFLEKIAPRIADLPAPHSLMHGDYGPQNMSFAGKRLYVFDLQRNFDDVVYHDVAYFLVTLKTVNPYPRYPRFNRRCALSLEQPFLQGYFARELDRQQQLTLRLFYLCHLIGRALKQYDNSSSGRLGPRLAKLLVNVTYPRLLRREMHRITSLLPS